MEKEDNQSIIPGEYPLFSRVWGGRDEDKPYPYPKRDREAAPKSPGSYKDVSNQASKVLVKTEETEVPKESLAMDPKENIKLMEEHSGVISADAAKNMETADELADNINFIIDCLGVNESVKVLCDASFIVWVIRNEEDPRPSIRACFSELGSELKTTKCVIASIAPWLQNFGYITSGRSAMSIDMTTLSCLCNHPYMSRALATCIQEVLTKPKYNDYFLATRSKSLYGPIQNALTTPMITVVNGKITVLPLTPPQKELFNCFKERRLGLGQQDEGDAVEIEEQPPEVEEEEDAFSELSGIEDDDSENGDATFELRELTEEDLLELERKQKEDASLLYERGEEELQKENEDFLLELFDGNVEFHNLEHVEEEEKDAFDLEQTEKEELIELERIKAGELQKENDDFFSEFFDGDVKFHNLNM